MVLSLLFGKKYAKSTVGGVTLDATISEDHEFNSRVTNFPVEDGSIISDHIIKEPETLQITGIVTDTPLAILAAFNRSIDAFNRLIQIYENRERISVVTGIRVYTDMVMTSLQVPRNVQTGQSLTFVIELQKIFLDRSVRYLENIDNPFNKPQDKIPREIIADSQRYPFHQADPPFIFKDQAQSAVNAGIQDLLPVPNKVLPNIQNDIYKLRGLY